MKNNKLKEKLIPLVKSELEDHSDKLLMLPSPNPEVLLLTSTQKALEEQAEKILLVKDRRVPSKFASSPTETIKDQFTVAERDEFFPPSSASKAPSDLFTIHERCVLVEGIFYDIQVSDDQLEELLSDGNEASKSKHRRHRQTRTTFNLWYLLQSNEWVTTVTPVHHLHEKKEAIFRDTMKLGFFRMPPC